MQNAIDRLRSAVRTLPGILAGFSEAESERRPAPGRWTKKEVVGHLIDSASNNHRRFVEAQGKDDLVCLGYAQDDWVQFQRYQEAELSDLLRLWAAFNHHLAHVVATTPRLVLEQLRTKHNLDQVAFRIVPPTEPATLAYFVRDYVAHLEHHLAQIRALTSGGELA